jgi:excisionase family DNA binding protein
VAPWEDLHMPAGSPPRFLALTEVAEVLNISVSQVYALVRRGELPAIKIGGRGQWRVEYAQLEGYIADAYEATRTFIASHPFVGDDPAEGDEHPVTPTTLDPA